MHLQRLVIGVVAAALVASSNVAFAQSDGAQETARQDDLRGFHQLRGNFQPKVVYWAVAHGQGGKPESAGVNVAGIEKMVPVLSTDARKHPRNPSGRR